MNKKTIRCPDCGHTIVTEYGFISWCDQCDWNVSPKPEQAAKSFLEKIYKVLGQKLGENLKQAARNDKLKKRNGRLSRSLLFLLSVAVYAFNIITLLLGVWLLTNHHTNLFAIFGGTILIGAGWVTRPRLNKRPPLTLVQKEHSELYALVNDICTTMDAPKFHTIAVNNHFNASSGHYGIFNKRLLTIGLPLLHTLSAQEFVALIAHEAAHGKNRDPLRTTLTNNAHTTLLRWHQLIYPRHIWDPDYGIYNLLIAPMNLLMLLTSNCIKLLATCFIHLSFRESQIAEFRADLYAADLSGKQAMLSLLNKLHYHTIFSLAVQEFTLSKTSSSLWEILTDKFNHIPESESKRLSRLQQLSGSRLNLTHPPTLHRSEVIKSNADDSSRLLLTQCAFHKIKESLSPWFDSAAKKLKDDYRNNLYQ